MVYKLCSTFVTEVLLAQVISTYAIRDSKLLHIYLDSSSGTTEYVHEMLSTFAPFSLTLVHDIFHICSRLILKWKKVKNNSSTFNQIWSTNSSTL